MITTGDHNRMQHLNTIEKKLNEIKNKIEISANESMTNSKAIGFINDKLQKIKNIKSHVEPAKLNLSSSASKLSIVLGAQTQCSFGIGLGSYIGTRVKTIIGDRLGSNISDSKLGINIIPFMGCSSPTNPFFKPPFMSPPLPCIPQVSSFIPTSPTVLLENTPITTINSKGICTFSPGGVISFINAGQYKVTVK